MPQLEPVRWGILGTANIARKRIIPAMQKSSLARLTAIASRDLAKARDVATSLGIPGAYGSYEDLLADPEIEAVYNPLPNHLHVPWSVRAAEAGKHVLCEKPIALSADEARQLLHAREENGVQIAEAVMVRTHPQWRYVRELVAQGRIGELRQMSAHFSYFRRDPTDIRSQRDWGGGALMDIGCYPITLARWMFGDEPDDVVCMLEHDPELGVDRLTSAMLRFPSGQATFTCAGQLVPYQRVHLFGTAGRIEVEVPFNAPTDSPCRILIDDGSGLGGTSVEPLEIPEADQFQLEIEQFAEAVRGEGEVPVSVEDAVANMEVIDALFRSAERRDWQKVRTTK
jgi:predicted dehydrogenase